MSSLPSPYRVAFQEASEHFEDFPLILARIKELEEQIAKRERTSEEKAA